MSFAGLKNLALIFFVSATASNLYSASANPLGFPAWQNGQSVSYQYKIYRNGNLEKVRNFKWAVFGPHSLTTTTAAYFDFETVALSSDPNERLAMSLPVVSPGLDSARIFHAFMGRLDLLGSNFYRVKFGEDAPFSAFFQVPRPNEKNDVENLVAGSTITNSVSLSTTAGTFVCRRLHFGHANVPSNQDPLAFDYFQNASIPVTGIVACYVTQNIDKVDGSRDFLETKIECQSSAISGEISEFSGGSFSAGPF